jgi:hypothetical protein
MAAGKEDRTMTEPNKVNDLEAERVQEVLAARAELLRLAEEQDVAPVTNFDELLGDPDLDDPSEGTVDDFLRSLREWRETPSNRSIE